MRGTTSRGVWNQLDGLLVFGATGQLSDEELLGRFVGRRDDGAEAAFAALVEPYGPMVLGVGRRVLGNRHEAEDAFQATFLVLARKAASIARPEQLANWLFGVARRTALDARGRTVCRKARERRVHAISRSEIKPAGDDQPDLDELRTILDQELARLPERSRGALVLCELDGLSRRAAAARLGIPGGRSPAGSPGPRTACAVAWCAGGWHSRPSDSIRRSCEQPRLGPPSSRSPSSIPRSGPRRAARRVPPWPRPPRPRSQLSLKVS